MLKTLPLILGLTLFGAAATASAQEDVLSADQGLTLGIEIGPNFVLNDDDELSESAGVGINGVVGFRLHIGEMMFLTPEAKVGFESPGTPNAFRILGGARLGLRYPFTPVAFAHLGGMVGDLDGFAWDAGGGLVFNFDALAIGAVVSYNRAENQDVLDNDDAFEWVQLAATATLVL